MSRHLSINCDFCGKSGHEGTMRTEENVLVRSYMGMLLRDLDFCKSCHDKWQDTLPFENDNGINFPFNDNPISKQEMR